MINKLSYIEIIKRTFCQAHFSHRPPMVWMEKSEIHYIHYTNAEYTNNKFSIDSPSIVVICIALSKLFEHLESKISIRIYETE